MTNPATTDTSRISAKPPPSAAHAGLNVKPDAQANAEQRADWVLCRLEQFIRDGRTFGEGMSFRQWQDMARAEIINALIDAEYRHYRGDRVTKKYLFVIGSAMVTLGFWGTAFAYGRVSQQAVGIVVAIVGLIAMLVAVEWRTRRYMAEKASAKRAEKLARIQNLTRRIKQLEKQLEDEAERLEEQVEEKRLRPSTKKLSPERQALAQQMNDLRARLSSGSSAE
ncbi:MAG: hypothetical protein ACPGOV_14685 [Magnetovibrionaceae bacterium]